MDYSTLSHAALVEQCQLKDKQLAELMMEYHNISSDFDGYKADSAKILAEAVAQASKDSKNPPPPVV